MDKISWRFVLEGIGILSVVGSLALVTLEVQQNNDLMAAEARFNRLSISSLPNQIILETTPINILETFAKDATERTREESSVMNSFYFVAFNAMNWTFAEIPSEEYPVNLWRNRFSNPRAKEEWENQKEFFAPEFVEYIETNILDR